jgi:hypothetical protein
LHFLSFIRFKPVKLEILKNFSGLRCCSFKVQFPFLWVIIRTEKEGRV